MASREFRLADFLIELLRSQAETLVLFAAHLGESALIEILENVDELPDYEHTEFKKSWWESELVSTKPYMETSSSHYDEIADAVRRIDIPQPLDFYIWAYPYYRHLIESSCPLGLELASHPKVAESLTEDAFKAADEWLGALRLPPDVHKKAQGLSHGVWAAFRRRVLQGIGQRQLKSL